MSDSKSFYITTAITYANSTPHLGHAYEEIATDALARWKRCTGFEVQFVTGLDEHSVNVENRASELQQTPQQFCDEMAKVFQSTWKDLKISYNRFIRTSEPAHHRAAQEMLRRATAAGDVYKGKYEGWYCNSCENYYTEAELKAGACPVHGTKAVWLSEENYFFRLSRYTDRLIQHIEAHPDFIQPETRRNEMLNILKGGLKDISISRAKSTWGIPFPDDPAHVVYVWFDALINYISAIGFPDDMAKFNRVWPADVHVIGKDITRFHCIIWPAMLMSTGLPLPKRVFGHGFISLKGEKISKTRGNVLDPLELAGRYGVDAFRYVLLAANNFALDSDFSEEEFIDRYNSDLANDLGNLLNRTLTMVEKYCEGCVPTPGPLQPEDAPVVDAARGLYPAFDQAMERLNFSQAAAAVWDMINKANKYIEDSAPWSMFKQGSSERLNTVMRVLLESLRLAAVFVHPFMPETTVRILEQLGDPQPRRLLVFPAETEWGRLAHGQKICKAAPLFPRLEKKKAE